MRRLALLAGAAFGLAVLGGGSAGAAGWWKPPLGSTLQVQFDGDVDQTVQASVYDLDQVSQLVSSFDFSLDEQCAQYKECDALRPFITAG